MEKFARNIQIPYMAQIQVCTCIPIMMSFANVPFVALKLGNILRLEAKTLQLGSNQGMSQYSFQNIEYSIPLL